MKINSDIKPRINSIKKTLIVYVFHESSVSFIVVIFKNTIDDKLTWNCL